MEPIATKLRQSRAAHVERFRRWHAHPFGVPIMVFVGLLVLSGIVLAVLASTHTTSTFRPSSSYIVIVSHDSQKQTVPTDEPTVGDLLKKLNIKLGSHDRVEASTDTAIVQDNFRINIYRAVPVTITDGFCTATVYT